MYLARITVTLRPSILDPKGKAAGEALHQLGYADIRSVRIGKHIELRLDVSDESEAHALADEACRKLLANEVMEDFTIHLERI